MDEGSSPPGSVAGDLSVSAAASVGPLSFSGLTDFMGRGAGSDAASSDELPPGTLVGDARIVTLLGAGGMGRVYEAVQESTQRTVAVKVIRPGVVSAVAARRLAHEAQILGRLSHPGIARIYSAGVARIGGSDLPFFVMEYVDEPRSLTAFAAAGNLSRRERVELFRQVCLAVAHGHERGVVHRDLKPGNILVDRAGQPKVIDFGVARCTAEEGQLTTMHTGMGELLGTAQYMAPEQLFGTADDIDARADVYALGLVLYELLTGDFPYEVRGRPIYEVARVVREVEPRSLSTLDRDLRGDLTAIVATCLDKERGRRYPSAAAVAADLGRHLRGEAIVARPPGLLESLARLASRHKAATLGLAAVLTTLVVAAVGMSLLAVRAERQRALATASAELASRQLYRANVRSLQSFIESDNPRAARAILRETRALAGDSLPLELRCLAADLDEALVVLEPTGDPVVEVAFSADGRRLETTSAEPLSWRPSTEAAELLSWRAEFFRRIPSRRRVSYAVTAGEGLRRLGPATGDPLDAAGSSGRVLDRAVDGSRLELDADGYVILQRADETAPTRLGEPRGRLAGAAFSPEAARVAVLGVDGRLDLWDADGGRLIGSLDYPEPCTDFTFSPDGSRVATLRLIAGARIQIRLFESEKGRRLSELFVPRERSVDTFILAFSHDGGQLATAAWTGGITIWSSDTGEPAQTLAGHSTLVTALAWSADGRRLASGDQSGRICIWNLATGRLERQCIGHSSDILSLAFSPEGSRLVSGGVDHSVRMWETTASRPLAAVPLAGDPLVVTFDPAGQELAVASPDGIIEVWSTTLVERRHCLTVPGTVNDLAYAPDGGLLAAATYRSDGTGEVVVWDAATGAERGRLSGIMGGSSVAGAVAARFNDDASLLVTTSGDGSVTVWSLDGSSRLWEAKVEQFQSLAKPKALFCLGGELVAHKQPYLFDARTGKKRQELVRGQIWSQAVSFDGRLLARGMAAGRTYLIKCTGERSDGRREGYDVSERTPYLLGHTEPVLAIDFDATGTWLATASADGTARIWNVADRTEVAVLSGHEGPVARVAFTPGGRRVVTSSVDGTARIWDAAFGFELCQFSSPGDRPATTVLSPDGRVLVIPSRDAQGPFLRLLGLTNADVTSARQIQLQRDAAAAPAAGTATAARTIVRPE